MNKIQESAPFFEELKKLRIERDIELSEVSTRTKINLEYLEAMAVSYTHLTLPTNREV